MDQLTRKIEKAKLMKFITIEPERFHPYLVVEIYWKAVVAADNKSFCTRVHGTIFNISTKSLVEVFELSTSGVSIYTYMDGTPNIECNHWNQWKKPDFESAFKLATRKGSLTELPALMLDIGANSELSTKKYKPMMALDDEVEANSRGL